MISGKTIADTYENLLTELYHRPQFETHPRGMVIRELINCSYTIHDPSYFLIKTKSRNTIEGYLAGELIWYLSGNNDFEHIGKFSKFWNKLTDDGKLNSAYGKLIWYDKNKNGITPWEWAYTALVNDRDTRQAVVHFNLKDHAKRGEKDFPCTMYGQFFIRNNTLNLIVNMRSQDIWFGYTYDAPFFSLMLIEMANQLNDFENMNVNVGSLTMNIGSLHLYGKDISGVEEIFKTPMSLDNWNEKYVYVETDKSLRLDTRLFDKKDNEFVPSEQLQFIIDKWYKKTTTKEKTNKIELTSNFLQWLDDASRKGVK